MRGISIVVGFAILVSIASGPFACRAQAFTISSNPTASSVLLYGPTVINGVTPFEVPMGQSGRFRVQIEKPGFETNIGWLDVTAGGSSRVGIARARGNVSEVTLSLLGMCGPSKFVRGERDKGIFLSLSQGSALLAAAYEEWRARGYREDYEDAQSLYLAAGDEGEAATYHSELVRNYELSGIARGARDRYLIAAAAPWLVNVIENLFLDRSRVVNGPGGDGLTFALRRVSVPSAALRATLFPGAGHFYAGRDRMGYLWGGSVLAVIGVTLAAETKYRESRLEYNDALSSYDAASSEEEVRTARDEVETTFDDMDGWYKTKNVLRMVSGGLWLLSILDAGRVGGTAGAVNVSERSVTVQFVSLPEKPGVAVKMAFQ